MIKSPKSLSVSQLFIIILTLWRIEREEDSSDCVRLAQNSNSGAKSRSLRCAPLPSYFDVEKRRMLERNQNSYVEGRQMKFMLKFCHQERGRDEGRGEARLSHVGAKKHQKKEK